MFNVLTLNKIAACGLNQLDSAKYSITDDQAVNAEGIILRSFAMHDMELPSSLLAVARAGAGTNNIPVDKCAEKGIVVFNTPGANANGVKELVIAGLLLASRDIVGGVNWASTLTGDDVAKQVEKGKSNFAGSEIKGKTLGVIGLGAIGVLVANAAISLGMKVIGYDPFLSINSAWHLDSHVAKAASYQEIFANCDFITVHVPLNDDTRNLINKEALDMMKDGVKILNFARGQLVNNEDITAAIESGKVSSYVVDFPLPDSVGKKGIVAIPHLGASTAESEDNCAIMAANELAEYLETGNIVNSVNYPNCSLPESGDGRIAIMHKNVPKTLSAFTTILSESGLNIEDMINKSKGDFAYSIFNTNAKVSAEVADKLASLDDVIRVRIIR